MKKEVKNYLCTLIFTVMCLSIIVPQLNAQPQTAEKSLQTLLEGNKRFVSGTFSQKNYSEELKELTKGQHPYAIIVCCSDSRVPPEIIFDESLGKLFVVRVAGNVIDSVTLGSIEYAAEHLHTNLLVVLGHESCGAVNAALDGGETTPNIAQILRRIDPAVKKAYSQNLEKENTINFAIDENVKNQIEACVSNSKTIKELVENKELKIVGAFFNLKTGIVDLIHTNHEE
ncbi:MAG: carbonic anhydrase [bacterium]